MSRSGGLHGFRMRFRRNCEACSHLHDGQLRRDWAESTRSSQFFFTGPLLWDDLTMTVRQQDTIA